MESRNGGSGATGLSGTAPDDHALAAAVARGAGRLLRAVREQGLLAGSGLGKAGDALAHAWIARVLAAHRPDDAVLSEEGAHDTARLASSRVWVVDPLDGTREYAEERDDWAVHVCLAVDGVPQASAVALPALDTTHGTAPGGSVTTTAEGPAASGAAATGPAAGTSGMPAPGANATDPARGLRILVSRSRPPAVATAVAERLGAELVPMGSAGAKSMAVLSGAADAYLHAGGQYEWDSAAPAGVVAAAGLHVSRLDGSPLRYNQPDPYLPDLLVCRQELAERLLKTIAEVSAETADPDAAPNAPSGAHAHARETR